MDSALEKFEVFDFMGIWGPGAITVTYFMATLFYEISGVFRFLEIDIPYISEGYKWIILYSVVAYTVGVVLHELGKMIADRIALFDFSEAKKQAYCEGTPKGFGAKIRAEHKEIIESFIPKEAYQKMTFHAAVCDLKYKNGISVKRINLYHSIYAMSRGLFLCFSAHALAEIIAFLYKAKPSNAVFYIVLFDVAMAVFFLERAYRYFLSWIRNVFTQYYITTRDDTRRAPGKTVPVRKLSVKSQTEKTYWLFIDRVF